MTSQKTSNLRINFWFQQHNCRSESVLTLLKCKCLRRNRSGSWNEGAFKSTPSFISQHKSPFSFFHSHGHLYSPFPPLSLVCPKFFPLAVPSLPSHVPSLFPSSALGCKPTLSFTTGQLSLARRIKLLAFRQPRNKAATLVSGFLNRQDNKGVVKEGVF